jgi:hypothetical protein
MKYLYATLTRTGLATMDNVAKSCYDRIICNKAMIVSQYFGISKKAAVMQSETLQQMCFRTLTALGDSKKYYKHTQSTPIHGTGQGSCITSDMAASQHLTNGLFSKIGVWHDIS